MRAGRIVSTVCTVVLCKAMLCVNLFVCFQRLLLTRDRIFQRGLYERVEFQFVTTVLSFFIESVEFERDLMRNITWKVKYVSYNFFFSLHRKENVSLARLDSS